MTTRRRRCGGQALVMVTFALVAMIGMLGLAIDFAYAYFLEKTMQAAADTAALAAVQSARESAGAGAPTCSTVNCYVAPTLCTSITTGTARAGCLYAVQNGFANADVSIQANDAAGTADDTTCSPGHNVNRPPTAGCVDTLYWVTVRISRRLPQLFSAVLGFSQGGVSARATAAIAELSFDGSLYLTNRNTDLQGIGGPNVPPYGTNLEISGGGTVNVPGGIRMASSSSVNGHESGRITANSGNVISPYTYVRSGGTVGGSHYDNWVCSPGGAYCPPVVKPDGENFYDPMSKKNGQPPIYGAGESPAAEDVINVPGGILTESICPGWVCPPGIYVATETDTCRCGIHPSGAAIRTANNTALSFGGASFGRYIFVGGLSFANGTNATFSPGRYVFAGTLNPGNAVFDAPNGTTLTGGNGSDAGRLMITTDFRTGLQRTAPAGGGADVGSYAGQMDSVVSTVLNYFSLLGNQSENPWMNTGLRHGSADIQAGNNASSSLRLEGLRDVGGLPPELKAFTPVLLWQDQHNSTVWYDQNGQVDMSCGGHNSPCANPPDSNTAPMLSIWASPFTQYYGAIYQPRGAWTRLQGSGAYNGPLQIFTGAITVGGTPTMTLTGVTDPVSYYAVALVE